MSLKESMDSYFAKLMSQWEQEYQSLPQIPVDEDVDPAFYESISEEDGLATWRPKAIIHRVNFEQLEEAVGFQFHPSLREYLATYYFATLGGTIDPYQLELDPILPGNEYQEFVERVRGYQMEHEGSATIRIPIGVESDGGLVVVANDTGAVELEDWDGGSFEPLAPSLSQLFEQLDPALEME